MDIPFDGMKSTGVIKHLNLVPHPEGGFFREIYRSGSTPMTTKGQTDFDVPTKDNKEDHPDYKTGTEPYESLCKATYREHRRPDGDIRRNCLTSIIWMPTNKNPVLNLSRNLSDHVHFWHGGKSFEYYIYDPITKALDRQVLGPNIHLGEKLQVPVRGGYWKCGKLLPGKEDFCLIGEAVAPGFDFHDFSWVTEEQLQHVVDVDIASMLLKYLHNDVAYLSGKEVQDAKKYY